MIRINLLPHREARRKERRAAFVALMVFSAILGGLVVLGVGTYIATLISDQTQRNAFIQAENARLDIEIKEIATLKQEIEGLIARQRAVEDLQSDRNQPVYLMDELVKQVPEGIYLRGFKQAGQRVVIDGYAQSNERVSELLRNVGNNSPWLERPDLVEIRSGTAGAKDARKVYDFTVNVGIKRPRDQNQPAVPGAPGMTGTAAVTATPAPVAPVSTAVSPASVNGVAVPAGAVRPAAAMTAAAAPAAPAASAAAPGGPAVAVLGKAPAATPASVPATAQPQVSAPSAPALNTPSAPALTASAPVATGASSAARPAAVIAPAKP
jgi:type IV pilus assembly protein PilN